MPTDDRARSTTAAKKSRRVSDVRRDGEETPAAFNVGAVVISLVPIMRTSVAAWRCRIRAEPRSHADRGTIPAVVTRCPPYPRRDAGCGLSLTGDFHVAHAFRTEKSGRETGGYSRPADRQPGPTASPRAGSRARTSSPPGSDARHTPSPVDRPSPSRDSRRFRVESGCHARRRACRGAVCPNSGGLGRSDGALRTRRARLPCCSEVPACAPGPSHQ